MLKKWRGTLAKQLGKRRAESVENANGLTTISNAENIYSTLIYVRCAVGRVQIFMQLACLAIRI